ncbi:hypothetical protein F5Y17DRAFT_344055 [Xylariaceae sp. FL0594]|nr:hypothetical protein F5Y17DRAFT_344055 [Xylariaceae sp. FL0594]
MHGPLVVLYVMVFRGLYLSQTSLISNSLEKSHICILECVIPGAKSPGRIRPSDGLPGSFIRRSCRPETYTPPMYLR